MLKTLSDNPNYLAKVIKLPALEPHPNADKLALVKIDFQTVITGLNAKEGETYVYFPLETALNKDFLSYTNSFAKSDFNRDKNIKSFFCLKGRVRSVRLRGILSEGYVVPASSLNEWLRAGDENSFQITGDHIGKEFDTIGDVLICEKYIPVTKKPKQNAPKGKNLIRVNKIVEDQFRFHPSTQHLKRVIFSIDPEDEIDITYKKHGANCIIGKVLQKKKLAFLEKISSWFNSDVETEEYDLVYSSRRVIKSSEYDSKVDWSFELGSKKSILDQLKEKLKTKKQLKIQAQLKKNSHFYDSNVWEEIGKRYENSLEDGIVLYGEVVGHTSSGAYIQKGYDYGCESKDCEFYVFRVTSVSREGEVAEFSFDELIEYCQRKGLKHVPLLFQGKAKDAYPELDVNLHWRENFLQKLEEDYLGKRCKYCKNDVPAEGIVVSKRKGVFQGFKLKCPIFVEGETKSLDSGEISIEDEN